MTQTTDRATALLVVDMQNNVVAEAVHRAEVVATIAALVARARAEQVPVVWVQHSSIHLEKGSPEWEFVPELVPAEGEPVVHKTYGDAFEETDLAAVLAGHGVGRLVVTGAQTDACIRATLHGSLTRGYDTFLVADAHTTEDMQQWGSPISAEQSIAYANLYWSFTSAPGRESAVLAAADVTW